MTIIGGMKYLITTWDNLNMEWSGTCTFCSFKETPSLSTNTSTYSHEQCLYYIPYTDSLHVIEKTTTRILLSVSSSSMVLSLFILSALQFSIIYVRRILFVLSQDLPSIPIYSFMQLTFIKLMGIKLALIIAKNIHKLSHIVLHPGNDKWGHWDTFNSQWGCSISILV